MRLEEEASRAALARRARDTEAHWTQVADELFDRSLVGIAAADAAPGSAASELDASWQAMMALVNMDHALDEEERARRPKKKSIRVPAPSPARRGRPTKAGAVSGSASSSTASARPKDVRPTSVGVQMYQSFDAHTELHLRANPRADFASDVLSSARTAGGTRESRPKAAQVALEAIRSPRTVGAHPTHRQQPAPHSKAVDDVALTAAVRSVVLGHMGPLRQGRESIKPGTPVWPGVRPPQLSPPAAMRISSCSGAPPHALSNEQPSQDPRPPQPPQHGQPASARPAAPSGSGIPAAAMASRPATASVSADAAEAERERRAREREQQAAAAAKACWMRTRGLPPSLQPPMEPLNMDHLMTVDHFADDMPQSPARSPPPLPSASSAVFMPRAKSARPATASAAAAASAASTPASAIALRSRVPQATVVVARPPSAAERAWAPRTPRTVAPRPQTAMPTIAVGHTHMGGHLLSSTPRASH